VALAAKEAYAFLGSPEGELALAEAAVYLALAPKSNAVYKAFARAKEAARAHPAAPVPLHLRNAPTALMKRLGHGKGYAYYHEDKEGSFAQAYLPEALEGARFYEPGDEGWEKKARARWEELKMHFEKARDKQ
jgi:putative ATPase